MDHTGSLAFFTCQIFSIQTLLLYLLINLKTEKMKKLFCVIVADAYEMVGLDSPIIFHIKCEDSNTADEAVKEMLEEEYGYDPQIVESLDIIVFEVTDLDIIELD